MRFGIPCCHVYGMFLFICVCICTLYGSLIPNISPKSVQTCMQTFTDDFLKFFCGGDT